MLLRKASAALAAGCGVVAKPSEETPLTAMAVAEVYLYKHHIIPLTGAVGVVARRCSSWSVQLDHLQ